MANKPLVSIAFPDLPDTYTIPQKTSDLTNDSGFITASGAAAAAPVQSVNGQTGAVIVNEVVLDNSLTMDNAAAPADKVGDLKSAFVDFQENKLPYYIVKNQYINSKTGEFQNYAGWNRTGLIPVHNYQSITVKSSVQSGYNASYKADGSFYNQINVTTAETEIQIPVEVAYVAFSNSATGMENLSVTFKTKDERKIALLSKSADDASMGFVLLSLTENEFVNSDGLFFISMGWSRTGYTYVGDARKIIIKTTNGNAYNAFYDENKTFIKTFVTSTGTNIIELSDDIKYIAMSNTTNAMIQQTVRVVSPRLPDFDYTNGNNVYSYPDIPDTVYSYDSGLTYSVKDGVITLDGTLTENTFRLDLPEITLDGYYIFNVEVLSGSYTGNAYLLLLPTTNPAYIINLDRHITRLDYFNNEERAVAVYVPNGATFNDLKFRIWIVGDLINQPYDTSHYYTPVQNVVGCNVGEYNTPSYPRIGDGTIYNVFGNSFAVCKDGIISKMKADSTVKFGLLADLHYGYQNTNHQDFYNRIYGKLSEQNIDFCMMLGDIIDSGYFSTSALCHAQLTQYKNSIQSLKCPNFPFSGNHDDDVSEFAHHGVIDYGDVRFIYFWADYEGTSGGGLVKDSELAWLEQQLIDSTAKINIMMCHYAVSTDDGFGWYLADAETRTAIEDLAESYGVKLFLNGHEHDHNISVGTAGTMTDISLPNGQYAYCICTIDNSGEFTATVYDSTNDTVLKTINVSLND